MQTPSDETFFNLFGQIIKIAERTHMPFDLDYIFQFPQLVRAYERGRDIKIKWVNQKVWRISRPTIATCIAVDKKGNLVLKFYWDCSSATAKNTINYFALYSEDSRREVQIEEIEA